MNEAVAVTGDARPSARYAAGVARGDWSADPAQQPVLVELDRLHAALLASPRRSLLDRLRDAPTAPVPGLYLWGGVGRGKTFLIDLFFDGLPIPDVATPRPAGSPRLRGKRRTHYHRFMREVHAQLHAHAGERDPLAAIAKRWRRELRVLVLDEFFVTDIGDAMLLGRLLERLFAEGVTLVTTSNIAPSGLFKDGLQRERFLPAIGQIERHCHVLYLDSDQDYRLRALTRSPVYRAPLDGEADRLLGSRWDELTVGVPVEPDPLVVEGRPIATRGLAEGHAWIDFAALCEGPRSARDYIEIATEYQTLLVGGIPVFDGSNDDPARRFVHLIDELYDRNVNLICTADATPVALYTGHRLAAAFERTASRLIEMQSAEYLAQEHRG